MIVILTLFENASGGGGCVTSDDIAGRRNVDISETSDTYVTTKECISFRFGLILLRSGNTISVSSN